jgi:hypothetical protein
MKMKTLLSMLAATWMMSFSALGVDVSLVERQLTTTGVEGWIHGSVPGQGLYVFTYRNPEDFFDYIEMSLVSEDDAITQQLAKLTRHDKVRIQGEFLKNPSPQKHIQVRSVEVIQSYENPYPSEGHSYDAAIPQDLLGKSSATFLVHAVAGDGHIVVVEYKDQVLPIYVKNAELTKDLFRNDLVELRFRIRGEPEQPVHLALNENDPQAVRVVESIRTLHGRTGTVEGALILFPQSPEIIFNVFAVQQELEGGLKRQFTLVNFDSPETFQAVRNKLQAAWDRHPGAYVDGRNKFVSTKIRVRATGMFNEVSESQANPQILLDSADSIELIEE